MGHDNCLAGECPECWVFGPGTLPPRARLLPGDEKIWLNAYYQVSVRKHDSGSITLSIKHRTKKAAHDWRHFQRIKNALAGPEIEAMELYPAESRLVDTANQYWLFCMPPGSKIPIGFNTRLVGYESGSGAVQRPFPEWAKPPDALSAEELREKVTQVYGDDALPEED